MENRAEQADFRKIPSVEKVSQYPKLKHLLSAYRRDFLLRNIQEVLEEFRTHIASGKPVDLSQKWVSARVAGKIEKAMSPSLRRVINATGIVLHTGLGRAMLSTKAREALLAAAGNYCNLEIELQSGQRGSRQTHIRKLLCDLTGSESCLVVNNTAAAVMLSLNTIGCQKEVVVARGQLVEIGGSFRMPSIMEKSQCRLVGIGTTNRVTVDDYRRAVTGETAVFMKVHTSNYRIVGYTADVSLSELVALGNELGVPVIYDLGSGCLASPAYPGFSAEPCVTEAVRAGADVITFSADKLLGGPQAGIILGKKKYLDLMKKNPIARVARVCKLTLAALEATLQEYLVSKDPAAVNPTLGMVTRPLSELSEQASRLAHGLQPVAGGSLNVEVVDGFSMIGGGSCATEKLPTRLVAVRHAGDSVDTLAHKLRMGNPPVIGRIGHDRLMLDVRTVKDEQIQEIVNVFKAVIREHP